MILNLIVISWKSLFDHSFKELSPIRCEESADQEEVIHIVKCSEDMVTFVWSIICNRPYLVLWNRNIN